MIHDVIRDYYGPELEKYGFIYEPDNQMYGPAGLCWRLSPKVGDGTYWIYGQKNLFDIKIHNFSFYEDKLMVFDMPECLSITRYDSISGEELKPYRRLEAGCIKSFIGGYEPFKAVIHKNIPIRSVGIEIMPAYYEDYLRNQYPGEYKNPCEAFRQVDQTMDFPEMSRLLNEIKDYRGEGIAARLFYEGKIAQAVSLTVERLKKLKPAARPRALSGEDIDRIHTATAYLGDHYAFDVPLEQLAKIACMGTTKLKQVFKQVNGCTITEYIQQRRMGQAEYLLTDTNLTIGQVAQTVGYANASRFAELFRKSTGLLPGEYRKAVRKR